MLFRSHGGVTHIGVALAEKGRVKEAKEIAMTLIEKNALFGAVWEIGVALAEKGGVEEAKEIVMTLIEKNEVAKGIVQTLIENDFLNEEPDNVPEGLQNNNAIGKSCCTIS